MHELHYYMHSEVCPQLHKTYRVQSAKTSENSRAVRRRPVADEVLKMVLITDALTLLTGT